MRYLDVCAGISASTVAWKPLGWEAAAYSEIEAAPRAVLSHHYPDTPLHGDFTTIRGNEYGPIDLLVGGTPCQDFSVAGLRAGLDGDRGNLSLEFLRLADRTRPRWVVWENVPGVLSIDGGRAFGAILGGLGELGYGFAYRVLDAQFFGVPQRRRRVFVVGCAGDWRGAAAVLSERHSLSGHPAPRRKAGQSTAGTIGASSGDWSRDNIGESIVAQPIAFATQQTPKGWDVELGTCPTLQVPSRSGGGQPHAVAFVQNSRDEVREFGGDGQTVGALAAEAGMKQQCYVAFDLRGREAGSQLEGPHDTANIRAAAGGSSRSYVAASAVRRLTPRECERLQGFPDDRNTVTVRVCRTEEERREIASSVPQASTALSHDQSAPVAVRVQIDLERPGLLLHSLGRSSLSVSDAADASWSALPIQADVFVRLAALMTRSLARATRVGREASLQNIRGSSPLWNGSASVLLCGREIERLAADAEVFMSVARLCTTFTMSEAGPISPTTEQDLEILSCCVSAAIAGFIPETIRQASSYAVQIEVVGGYTLVPHRGKPMADGPRYKALGNSMAVPVMRWIGERIAMVEALRDTAAEAA